jgi:hypothetical protein
MQAAGVYPSCHSSFVETSGESVSAALQVSLLRLPEGGTSGVQSKGSGYDSDVSVLGGHSAPPAYHGYDSEASTVRGMSPPPRGGSPRGLPRYGMANYDSDVSTRSYAWQT